MLARLQPSLSTLVYRLAYAVLTLIAALSLALVASGRAHAAPVVDGTFDLSGNAQRIALGPDGNMWMTLSSANEVARITPQGGVTEFDIPLLAGATGIGAGPDGKVWVTLPTFVGNFDPADPVGTAARFPADIAGGQNIVTGPDGNLWTVSADKLLKITPAGVAQAFPILTAGVDIVASGDLLWISDVNGGEIVSATTDGAPTRYPTGGNPRGIAAGPGGQIGYTDPAPPHSAGRLFAGGSPMPTLVTMGTDPYGMAFGADGAYWFAQPFGNNLGRLTTDGVYTELADFGPGAGPRYVAAGPGNTLWVALQGLGGIDANKVARVSGLEPPQPTPVNPIAPGDIPPILSKLAVTPKRFRVAKAPTAVTAGKRGTRRSVPAGTTITFTLNRAATVRLTIERKLAGRKRGGKCVKPKRSLRSAKPCARYVKRGTLTRRILAGGAQSVRFSGRIGRRALGAGSYRLTAVATDAGGRRSVARRTTFTVVPPAR